MVFFAAVFYPPKISAEFHATQTPKTTPSRADVLSDLKQRGIVTPDAEDFTAEDLNLLSRMKRAESLGAVDLLAGKYHSLQGLVFETKANETVVLHLTQIGFDRYIFFLSQKALDYFESRGAEMKWAFKTSDLEGHALFNSKGLLTQSGEDLFYRLLEKIPTRWKLPSGKIMANYTLSKPTNTNSQ